MIAVKHDSTGCNQSANTVNAVSDDSDSVSSSTDVPPEYKKPAIAAKILAFSDLVI
ncbi:hypothetical protein HMPREF1583_01357 [Gardnerella vaginalis JCP8151B]|nr:hypothetical protein HMPREF1583_01357 [Gardnerella vaginalis JCP8151B]